MISEGRPPLCNTSSEAGALEFSIQKVRIENESDRKPRPTSDRRPTDLRSTSNRPTSDRPPTDQPCLGYDQRFHLFTQYKNYCLHILLPKFCNQGFKVFLETTFFLVSCSLYPDRYGPKIFVRFSKSATTFRYAILDSRFSPLKRNLGRQTSMPPLWNTSSEAGSALPSEVVVLIENDWDRKVQSPKFLKHFL